MNIEKFGKVHAGASHTQRLTDQALDAARQFRDLFTWAETGTDEALSFALDGLLAEISDAYVAASNLRLAVVELEEEVAATEIFHDELKRYKIRETASGYILYELKDADREDQPLHFICPNCVIDGKKSFLQGSNDVKICYRCEKTFHL